MLKMVLAGCGLVCSLAVAAAAADMQLSLEKAGMYIALGQEAKAMDVYARLIAAEPQNIRNYESRAFYFLRLNRLEEALTDFTTILAIDPKYSAGYMSRGLVYNRLGQQERADADYAAACRLGDAGGCSFAKGE